MGLGLKGLRHWFHKRGIWLRVEGFRKSGGSASAFEELKALVEESSDLGCFGSAASFLNTRM